MKAFCALLFAALSAGCGGDSTTDPPDGQPRVLFIGNSLTYSNDLPGAFRSIAQQDGADYAVGSVAKPNVALIDFFFDDGAALESIDNGHWDYVVLQQGPTWPGLCADTLALAARQFGTRIRSAGGKSALLMTWPRVTDLPYIAGVHAAYENAASESGSLFIPAGDAWRIAWRDAPDLALYASDDYHPAELGTYLTALVIYERLTKRDVRGLPPIATIEGRQLDVAEETVRVLQRAAHEASVAADGGVVTNVRPAQGAARLVAGITC